jgi:chemotaxis protein methyltransferase CheR
MQEVQKNLGLWQELVNFLTVNETYFFREIGHLELLVDFAKCKNTFDILCLPCASGEEVYTIVMMLEMAGLSKKLGKIVGIDINSDVIKSANTGRYAKRSFHKMTNDVRDRFFDPHGDMLVVKDLLKQKVHFQNTNIFDIKLSSIGRFDFVFSRNMLIYFDKTSREKAGDILINILKDDGVLFLGHADLINQKEGFHKHAIKGNIYYKKTSH